MSKHDVSQWETVAVYVATYPSDDGEGACDVEVQIGEAAGQWYVRTQDDAGGMDEGPVLSYGSRRAAAEAAEELASEMDESDGTQDAEQYLRAGLERQAGDPDPAGEWCVYWETALDDAGPRARYATRAAAEAAARLADADLRRHHPGGGLLCGHSVRVLDGSVWVEVSE